MSQQVHDQLHGDSQIGVLAAADSGQVMSVMHAWSDANDKGVVSLVFGQLGSDEPTAFLQLTASDATELVGYLRQAITMCRACNPDDAAPLN
jgi:hypothetical protein